MHIDPSVKSDELAFMFAIALSDWPRDTINASGALLHYKRCWRWLEKWERKGWYDYGVALDLGWLTDEGEQRAELAAVELSRRLEAIDGGKCEARRVLGDAALAALELSRRLKALGGED